MKIYTTIGVYPNGTYVTNGVSENSIIPHIAYNISARFGRALFVDGILVYHGCIKIEFLTKFMEEHGELLALRKTVDTAPYN